MHRVYFFLLYMPQYRCCWKTDIIYRPLTWLFYDCRTIILDFYEL